MLLVYLSWVVFSLPAGINLEDHQLSTIGRTSCFVTYDGELLIKESDKFLVFRPNGRPPETVDVSLVVDQTIKGTKGSPRIIQNIVKIEDRYLVYVLVLDDYLFFEVFTYDEELEYLGLAKTYNDTKSPFFRNLVHLHSDRYMGLEMHREQDDFVTYRWSEYVVSFSKNRIPVFRKLGMSFFVSTESLMGIKGAYNRAWAAATPDSRELLVIEEASDYVRKFSKEKGFQFKNNIPLEQEGFVSYRYAFSEKNRQDITTVSADTLAQDISKNCGLYPLEGMGDLFVLGYEIPTDHPSGKMALVIQVIDANGVTLVSEKPLLGGIFAGVVENRAVVLVPEESKTKDSLKLMVQQFTFE